MGPEHEVEERTFGAARNESVAPQAAPASEETVEEADETIIDVCREDETSAPENSDRFFGEQLEERHKHLGATGTGISILEREQTLTEEKSPERKEKDDSFSASKY